MKTVISGILSGLLVSIGGIVFLSCESRYVGAVLFSVALLCICYKGYYLFTGKVGLAVEKGGKHKIRDLILGLIGNAAGAYAIGIMMALVKPSLYEKAMTLVNGKLSLPLDQVFVAEALMRSYMRIKCPSYLQSLLLI